MTVGLLALYKIWTTEAFFFFFLIWQYRFRYWRFSQRDPKKKKIVKNYYIYFKKHRIAAGLYRISFDDIISRSIYYYTPVIFPLRISNKYSSADDDVVAYENRSMIYILSPAIREPRTVLIEFITFACLINKVYVIFYKVVVQTEKYENYEYRSYCTT